MRQSSTIEHTTSDHETIFGPIRNDSGFHGIERDIWGPFVWTHKHFAFWRPESCECFVLQACYGGDEGKLSLMGQGRTLQIDLYKGWNVYPLDLSLLGCKITGRIEPLIPVDGEYRELGIMIRRFDACSDSSRMNDLNGVLANKCVNEREYSEGQTIVKSYPTKLRINTATSCTMNPPCVYCDWSRTKRDETDSGFATNLSALFEMGGFYKLAEEIVDNSYGEPLLKESFWNYVDEFETSLKYFEFGTNGTLLHPENSKRLLGKNVLLYVSADAADPKRFSYYRNSDFSKLIGNLKSLCAERVAHRMLPKVLISYVAMRSNQDQVEPFLDLMKDTGVDGVKFIYLDPDPELERRDSVYGGFRFRYGAEVLRLGELQRLFAWAKSLGQSKGVPVITRLDFGAEEESGGGPICSEPWRNIHVLDRGIAVCLFSRTMPIARWSERGERPLEEFLWDVWNGERYREIRSSLAHGHLPELCLNARSCPIVRRRLDSRRP
jgi:MoaA/NifB/PqqE/SkfB family radical SAM enzyme